VYNIIINQIKGKRNKPLKGEPQMSYDTLKKLSINLKDLVAKYSYSPSNVREWNGNMVVYEAEKTFETKEQLEKWLLSLVEGHYDGETPISRSLTLYKRIMWLEENGFITKEGKPVDTEEVRKVLTGEKKVKPKMYVLENNRGYRLKSLKWSISLRVGGSYSKLYKPEVEAIQRVHAEFLERHGVLAVEIE
jgi:hypothetical protein